MIRPITPRRETSGRHNHLSVSDDDDQAFVEAQLGRSARARIEVASRCRLGLPVVAVVPPVLDSGDPFPTRYWLTCPVAHRRISTLEAQGGVRALDARALEDDAFGASLDRAHRRYAEERNRALPADPSPRPHGGVGGARAGVKCLHAHFADFLAKKDNPVGNEVAAAVGALDCAEPCVLRIGGEVVRNSAHRDPSWAVPSDWAATARKVGEDGDAS